MPRETNPNRQRRKPIKGLCVSVRILPLIVLHNQGFGNTIKSVLSLHSNHLSLEFAHREPGNGLFNVKATSTSPKAAFPPFRTFQSHAVFCWHVKRCKYILQSHGNYCSPALLRILKGSRALLLTLYHVVFPVGTDALRLSVPYKDALQSLAGSRRDSFLKSFSARLHQNVDSPVQI